MMSGKPRKFVYLDDESVNEHIASMGIGVAESKQQTETDEQESTRRRFANIALKNFGKVGEEGTERRRKSEADSLTLDLTAPYRFEMLRESLRESKYEIHTDVSGADRGDVVEMSCNLLPVSYSRLGVALEAKRRMYYDESLDQDTQDQFDRAQELLERLRVRNNDRFVARAFDGWKAGLSFDRSQFRQPPTEVLQAERQYTLFGRIERGLEKVDDFDKSALEDPDLQADLNWDEAWEPLSGPVKSEGEYTETLETLRETIQDLPGTHPFTEPSGEIPILGEDQIMFNMVIHPIAVYW